MSKKSIKFIFTLPETNIAHENLMFPGKYYQNDGFSMATLSEPFGTPLKVLVYVYVDTNIVIHSLMRIYIYIINIELKVVQVSSTIFYWWVILRVHSIDQSWFHFLNLHIQGPPRRTGAFISHPWISIVD